MDCAASITPPSTSFMEDSTIRAIKGRADNKGNDGCRGAQRGADNRTRYRRKRNEQNEERRAAQEVNYNAKRAVEHRHGPDAVFPTHHQQHAERQPDEISKQRGHDHHIKCFQRSLQKQVQHLLREHHPSPPRNARFVR